MVPWQRHVWPRNFYCELCLGVAGPGADVLDCRSCDVVMHYRCVMKKYGSINMNPRTWHCEFCSGTFELEKIQYDEDKKAYRMALIHFRMAVRLQGKLSYPWCSIIHLFICICCQSGRVRDSSRRSEANPPDVLMVKPVCAPFLPSDGPCLAMSYPLYQVP